MLSSFIKIVIKLLVCLFIRWVIALFLSTMIHSLIHYYIFPATEAYSYPIYFTFEPCNPSKYSNTKSDRCSFLQANVNLGGSERAPVLRKGVEYSFEIMLELPRTFNQNIGMFIVCIELLDREGNKNINPWGDISPRNVYQDKITDQIERNNTESEMKIVKTNSNERCKSTMLLPPKKSKIKKREYLEILMDPFGIFWYKPLDVESFPIASVRMRGKIPVDDADVGWAQIFVKNLKIQIYSAQMSVKSEIVGFQYFLNLCPAITGLTWLIINAFTIFIYLCFVDFPMLLQTSDRMFVSNFFSLSNVP